MSNSSTSRYESENRRYQRTAQTMISGSKWRHLNSAGSGLIMECTAAYQTCSLGFCNTAQRLAFDEIPPTYLNFDYNVSLKSRSARLLLQRMSSLRRSQMPGGFAFEHPAMGSANSMRSRRSSPSVYLCRKRFRGRRFCIGAKPYCRPDLANSPKAVWSHS